MKQNKKIITLILLVLLCAALLATGTYAKFISVESVKRVVTTKSTDSELCFSSNYLEETDQLNPQYAPKIITVNANVFRINLDIYNFPLTDISKFSQTNIEYTLGIRLIANDETVKDITEEAQVNSMLILEPSNPPVIGSHVIEKGSAKTDSYTISCNADNIEALRHYKIRITATPSISKEKMLAADFELVATSQSTHWQGTLIEADGKVYDAFNYQISGTAEETRKLIWAPKQVELSPWSLEDLRNDCPGATPSNEGKNTKVLTLTLGGEGKPTSYLLQFYKVNTFNGDPTISLGYPDS